MVRDGLCEAAKVGLRQHWDFWFGRSDPKPRSGILKAQREIAPKCGDAEKLLCTEMGRELWVLCSGKDLALFSPQSHISKVRDQTGARREVSQLLLLYSKDKDEGGTSASHFN